MNRETIAASQLATSTGGSSGSGSGSGSNSLATSADSATTLTAQGGGSGGSGGSRVDGHGNGDAAGVILAPGSAAAGKLQVSAGATSILTVDEDTLSLDRLNSLRIYMTSVKTLPFNLRIYGWVARERKRVNSIHFSSIWFTLHPIAADFQSFYANEFRLPFICLENRHRFVYTWRIIILNWLILKHHLETYKNFTCKANLILIWYLN